MNFTRVNWFTKFVFLGVICFMVFALFMTYFGGEYYPKNSFLCPTSDFFQDHFNVNHFVSDLNPYIECNSSYPPLALFSAYPFTLFVDYSKGPLQARSSALGILLYLIFVLFFLSIFFFLNKDLWVSGILQNMFNMVVFVISFPVFFLIDRGNYLIITLIFIYFFSKTYKTKFFSPCIFIAIAASIKIYPVLFIVLFLLDKKYKQFFISLFFIALFSLIPFFLYKGGFFNNFVAFFHNMFSFADLYNNPIISTSYQSGIFGFIKLSFLLFDYNNALIQRILQLFCFLTILPITYCVVKREAILWRRILAISCAIILLMPFSGNYNLGYLLIPLLLLFKTSEEDFERQGKLYLIILALLFIPKNYLFLHIFHVYSVSIQAIINPFLMLLMLILLFKQTHLSAYKYERFFDFFNRIRLTKKIILFSVPIFALWFYVHYVDRRSFPSFKKGYTELVNMNFDNVVFKNEKIGFSYWRKKFRYSSFTNAQFLDFDLGPSDFSYANLYKASFCRGALIGAKFRKARINNAIFSNCLLDDAKFISVKGSKVSFYKCILTAANFKNAILSNSLFEGNKFDLTTDFYGANLKNATFRSNTFDKIIFKNADLENAKFHIKWKDYLKKQRVKNFDKILWYK